MTEGEIATLDAADYVETEVMRFLSDPPDTDFQAGYLAALIEVWTAVAEAPEEPDWLRVAGELIAPR